MEHFDAVDARLTKQPHAGEPVDGGKTVAFGAHNTCLTKQTP